MAEAHIAICVERAGKSSLSVYAISRMNINVLCAEIPPRIRTVVLRPQSRCADPSSPVKREAALASGFIRNAAAA